ncbi:ankyrin [Lindgomyces ingoldianus]|uniref:Ankyrin n=1 Tax=Lindgomyces ingoldianus TaxID=673940 RepID=A0ACB6QP71_9PLEO|nr:ankyrin [Lindgomyces ingoldianus]KAF2468325.1 ankyrin [Lindgomyces ingoldianus]
MATSSPSSKHLITLCKNGECKQLLSELQQPATSQVALSDEYVVIDPDVGRLQKQFNLQRMLEAAARAGHADTVELLVRFGQQHGVAVSNLVTPLIICDALSHENSLQVLLKFHAVEPDVFSLRLPLGGSILGAACGGGPNSERIPRKKYLGLVRHLMGIGYNPNANLLTHPDTPGYLLYVACWQACREIVECLLEHGAVITGSEATRVAANRGRIDILEVLLQYGANLNECFTQEGINGPPGTALHAAVASRQVATVEWLLQHGADASLRNIEGKTAGDLLPTDSDEALKDILRIYGCHVSID